MQQLAVRLFSSARFVAALALGAWLAPLAAAAVAMEWVPIGDPGNPAERGSSNCYGAPCGPVSYSYFISKYEVTNAQYAEFLNAVATTPSVPGPETPKWASLYNPSMGSSADGGITQTLSSGSYSYSVKSGFGDKPVDYVSYWDAARFANWLNNGQGGADTETGAYSLSLSDMEGNTVVREALANTFLPSENEWYKAAYFNGASYYLYPAGSGAQTTCAAPGATPNTANCAGAVGSLTDVGAYTGSPSPYGTFDQGGNVWEWNEQIVPHPDRGLRGGGWLDLADDLAKTSPNHIDATTENGFIGFRVASLVPEPGTGLLVTTGLLGLAAWRRRGRAA